jgi:hypothetical protein
MMPPMTSSVAENGPMARDREGDEADVTTGVVYVVGSRRPVAGQLKVRVSGLRGQWPSKSPAPCSRGSDYRSSRESYPAWKPNMPSDVALEPLLPSAAISCFTHRASPSRPLTLTSN